MSGPTHPTPGVMHGHGGRAPSSHIYARPPVGSWAGCTSPWRPSDDQDCTGAVALGRSSRGTCVFRHFSTGDVGPGTSPLPGPAIGPLKMREARRPLGPAQSDLGYAECPSGRRSAHVSGLDLGYAERPSGRWSAHVSAEYMWSPKIKKIKK